MRKLVRMSDAEIKKLLKEKNFHANLYFSQFNPLFNRYYVINGSYSALHPQHKQKSKYENIERSQKSQKEI